MSKYGFKVAKIGKSVDLATILDNIIDNDFPFLKSFKQGTMSVNVTAAGTYTVSFRHGLGYAPFFVHYAAPNPANPDRKYIGCVAATGPGGTIGIDSYIDNEVLTLSWKDTNAAGATAYPYVVTFYYYIFYDKIG